MKQTGTVKWYDTKKGYGFIAGDNEVDYFVHQSSILMDGFRMLRRGNRVLFETAEDPKREGQEYAINVEVSPAGEDKAS